MPIKVPESQRLRGEEAIKALHDFIAELEEQKGKELTEKQTKALVKIAKGIISSIQAEMRVGTFGRLKKALMRCVLR